MEEPNEQSIYPPPPPHKSFYSNYLAFSLLLATIFSCDPPKTSTPTYTISGKVTDQFGKAIKKRIVDTPGVLEGIVVVTPATYKTVFPDDIKVEVWVDSANKVDAKADGSYSLTVKGPGTYQVTARYTGKDGNYKNSDPQTVKVTGQHNLNIPLKFGYTTTVKGITYYEAGVGGALNRQPGTTVIIETDYGTKIGEGTSKDPSGDFSITVSHPGKFTIKASAVLADGTRATDEIPNIETTATEKTGYNIFIKP